MAFRTIGKSTRVRPLLAAVCALAGAALFGAVVASALSIGSPRLGPPLQNPFDALRSVQ